MNLGCRIQKMIPSMVFEKLGEHSWNIVGNWMGGPVKNKVWEVALPNKFFDAVAAGLPSVSFGVPEVDRFIRKHDIGITVSTPEELFERWDEHTEKRKNLCLYRRELSMERFIGKLTDFYEMF